MLEFNPYEKTFADDPYPVYRRLRDEAPVYHCAPLNFWAISRYADVLEAHRDFKTFSSAGGSPSRVGCDGATAYPQGSPRASVAQGADHQGIHAESDGGARARSSGDRYIAHDERRRRLYCSDTFNVAWAWDVETDLTLSRRRILLKKDDCDGMALDTDGTQIRFGGADLKDYFINIVPADGGDSLKKGEPLKSPSILYRGRSEIAGVAVSPAKFELR